MIATERAIVMVKLPLTAVSNRAFNLKQIQRRKWIAEPFSVSVIP